MLVCASLLMCGCVESYEYEAASLSGEGNAFIVGNAVTTLGFKPGDALTFSVTIQRPDSSKQALCILSTTSKIVTLPEGINFAKGEKSKTVTLSFQSQEATTDTVKISVAPADASNYGVTSATYILKHYKVRHVDYVSGWFEKTGTTSKYWKQATETLACLSHLMMLTTMLSCLSKLLSIPMVRCLYTHKSVCFAKQQGRCTDAARSGQLDRRCQ